MAIHAITGKPGSGKSYAAVEMIRDLLIADRECEVVTNLPIDVRSLALHVQKTHPEVRVAERITLLGTEDVQAVREFWRYRGRGRVLENGPDGRPVVPGELWPVCYVLDEFHLAYNARAWKDVGPAALWYASQHRKWGDDVWWVTQFVDNVDKQFRVLTQDYMMVRNFQQETWLKWFRPPARMQRHISSDPPTNRNRTLQRWESVKLDLELARCYRSMEGVGVRGTVKVDRVQPKGVPVWVLAVIGPLVIVGVAVGGPMLVGKAIGSGVSAYISHSQPAMPATAGTVEVPGGQRSKPPVPAQSSVGTLSGPVPAQGAKALPEGLPEGRATNAVRVSLLVGLPGRGWRVGLSDGRMYAAGHPDLVSIDRARGEVAIREAGEVVRYRTQ